MIQNMCIRTFAEKMQDFPLGARILFWGKLNTCAQKRKEKAPDANQTIMEVVHNLYYFFNVSRFTYPAYDEQRKTNNMHELIPFVKMVNTYIAFSDADKKNFENIVFPEENKPEKTFAPMACMKLAQGR